jgi:hypothetical protein
VIGLTAKLSKDKKLLQLSIEHDEVAREFERLNFDRDSFARS